MIVVVTLHACKVRTRTKYEVYVRNVFLLAGTGIGSRHGEGALLRSTSDPPPAQQQLARSVSLRCAARVL